jgi:hypothetical protein
MADLDHLALLARLESGTLAPEVIRREVMAHLFSGCPDCKPVQAEPRRLRIEMGHADPARAGADALAAMALWKRLAPLGIAQQIEAVEAEESFHRWWFCRFLQGVSLQAAEPANAGAMAYLAHLALRVSRHLGTAGDPAALSDLRALGFASLGNALWMLGELHGARYAFAMARTLRAAGTGEPWVEAEILSQEALGRCAEHRLGDAVVLAERVLEIYAVSGGAAQAGLPPNGAMGALVLKAWCFYHLGEHRAALVLLREAERREHEPGSLLTIRSGMVWCGITLEMWPEAAGWLADALELAEGGPDQAALLRLRLAQARVLDWDGQRAEAELLLRQTAADGVERGLGSDAVLAWLEVVKLYLEEGEAEAIRGLAAEEIVLAFFLSEIGADQACQLLMFQARCRRGTLTREAIGELAGAMERGRRAPLCWWSAWGTVLGKGGAGGGAGAAVE